METNPFIFIIGNIQSCKKFMQPALFHFEAQPQCVEAMLEEHLSGAAKFVGQIILLPSLTEKTLAFHIRRFTSLLQWPFYVMNVHSTNIGVKDGACRGNTCTSCAHRRIPSPSKTFRITVSHLRCHHLVEFHCDNLLLKEGAGTRGPLFRKKGALLHIELCTLDIKTL